MNAVRKFPGVGRSRLSEPGKALVTLSTRKHTQVPKGMIARSIGAQLLGLPSSDVTARIVAQGQEGRWMTWEVTT